jgi:hypothetical protein
MPDSEYVVVVQGNEVKFECRLLFGFEHGQTISWSWFLDDQLVENSANNVEISTDQISTLTLKNTATISKNQIECRARNEFGEYNRILTLKIKSNFNENVSKLSVDIVRTSFFFKTGQLAWLWPTLGIVAELIILVLIIIIFNKKGGKQNNSNENKEK